ncbi:DUF421 domain-containing protein [Yinghuangia aomiensis]|uniref:DUF421 domain-containing protein n=1 Tax=Yinghuangia aomiensis TaxID=676205 RepID=A0ABP9I4V6_9ACTN
MWHDLWALGVPLAEKVIRTTVVYFVIMLLLRLAGKRGLAQIDTGDLVVMLLLSNVVQNAIIGPDNSLTGGIVGAAVLLAVNSLVVHTNAVSPRFEKVFQGTASVLVRDGAYDRGALRHLGLTPADVDVSIKHQGGDTVRDAELVTLEPGGLVVVRLREDEESADKGDIALLDARLARIEARLAALGGEPPRNPDGGSGTHP